MWSALAKYNHYWTYKWRYSILIQIAGTSLVLALEHLRVLQRSLFEDGECDSGVTREIIMIQGQAKLLAKVVYVLLLRKQGSPRFEGIAERFGPFDVGFAWGKT